MDDHQDAKPPSRKTLVSVYAKGHLLGALFGRYSRSWGREAKIVEAIASAHNDGAIDLLSIITNESLESVKKHEFFAGQNLYCKLIPHLDAQTKDMVHAVDCLIRAAGNDLAGGSPGNALAEWCQQDQARAGQLLELVNAGDTVAQSFIPLAVGNAEAEVRRDLIGHLNGKANMADDASRHNVSVFRSFGAKCGVD